MAWSPQHDGDGSGYAPGEAILRLQRAAGNEAVASLLTGGRPLQRLVFERTLSGALGGLVGREDHDATRWRRQFDEIKTFLKADGSRLRRLGQGHRLGRIATDLSQLVARYGNATILAAQRQSVGNEIAQAHGDLGVLRTEWERVGQDMGLLRHFGGVADDAARAQLYAICADQQKRRRLLTITAYVPEIATLPLEVLTQLAATDSAGFRRALEYPVYFFGVRDTEKTIHRGAGVPAGEGHTLREHGAHLSDTQMTDVAVAKNLDKGRWLSFEVQHECIQAVLTAAKSTVEPPGPLSVVNANGWAVVQNNRTFNTVTKPNNLHLAGQPDRHPASVAEIHANLGAHVAYLKDKVEAKDQPAGKVVGHSFPAGGGAPTPATRYDVILERDKATSEYKVLTAYPVV